MASCSLVKEMRSVGPFAVVVLLLVSYLTPAMACMVPDEQMNAEERARCRAMKNQCEQMEMRHHTAATRRPPKRSR